MIGMEDPLPHHFTKPILFICPRPLFPEALVDRLVH
jgi:hypothetical protein